MHTDFRGVAQGLIEAHLDDVPSANQFMRKSSLANEQSETWVNGLIQSIRRASSRQKLSGSTSERRYFSA